MTKSEGIRDIKGLFQFLDWSSVTLISLLVLLLAIATFVVYKLWKKKRRSRMAVVAVMRDPYEVLRERLEQLKKQSLSAQNAKEFHFSLSEIFRSYLELRLGFPATDRTVEEIQEGLKTMGTLSATQKEMCLDVLLKTDRVKFTDWIPEEIKSREMVNVTEKFIEQTRPRIDPNPGVSS